MTEREKNRHAQALGRRNKGKTKTKTERSYAACCANLVIGREVRRLQREAEREAREDVGKKGGE